MNTQNTTRFQQQFVIALATVGLTAAITLAAVGPDAMHSRAPSAPASTSTVAGEAMKTPVRSDATTPHFERSDEPAIEVDLVKPHGG